MRSTKARSEHSSSGAGRGRAPAEHHEVGLRGQPRRVLAPAEEPRGLLDEDQVGVAGPDHPGQRLLVVAQRADVVAEHPDHGRTVGLRTDLRQGGVGSMPATYAAARRSPKGHDGRSAKRRGQPWRARSAAPTSPALPPSCAASTCACGRHCAADQPALEGLADRVEDEVALVGDAAADDERRRVEERGQVGQAGAGPAGQLAEGVDGHQVALPRGRR